MTAQIICIKAARFRLRPRDPIADMWVAHFDFWMTVWGLR